MRCFIIHGEDIAGGYNALMDMLSSCQQCSIVVSDIDTATSKNIDVPFVRSFLVNTTSVLKNAGRGRIANPEIDVLSSPIAELEVGDLLVGLVGDFLIVFV